MTAITAELPLLRRWSLARIKLTLRTPRAVFFTFVFPLMFLTLFSALNGNNSVPALSGHGTVPFAQFYAPSIGIFGLTTACYSGLIFGLSTARDNGLLKRVRGTPLPMQVYLAAWLASAMLVGTCAVLLMFAVGVPVFGVNIYPSQLPAAAVTLVLGALCLGSLGLAAASLVKTADQATPVAQLTFLPLSFISGVFYPVEDAPSWLLTLANIFPLHHLVVAFDGCFQPDALNHGFSHDLWPLVGWTIGGLLVASRRFAKEA
jgi:ABC-2 type transport system permease protein